MLALVACGGGSIAVEDLPGDVKDARCDNLLKCEGIADRATCNGAIPADTSQVPAIQAAIKNGTIKYNGDKAGDCVDQLSGRSCEFEGFHNESACSDVLTGTVATGGACVLDEQCANRGNCQPTGSTCDPATTCCAGTCVGGSTVSALGGPCSDQMHTCGTTAYCKPGTTSGAVGTCTALVTGEGTACDAVSACVNPLFCNVNFQTGMGTCKKPAASGAACVRMDLLPCADSRDFCNTTSNTCVRRIAVGAACVSGSMPCVDYASCIAGTCAGDIPAGGACVVDSGANCAGSLACTNGTCQAQPTGPVCTL